MTLIYEVMCIVLITNIQLDKSIFPISDPGIPEILE